MRLMNGAACGALLVALVVAVPASPAAAAATLDCGNGVTMDIGARVAGLDPIVASDAVLQDQDFPPRPTDPDLLADWNGYAAAYASGTVDFGSKCSVWEDTTASNGTSPYWAGWVDNAHTYTDAETTFKVPKASGVSGARSSHWAGVGLGNSSAYPLVQAGAESWATGYTYGWIQVYPQTHELHLADFEGIAGHSLFVHVTFHTNIGYFHLVDLTAHIDRHYSRGFTGRPDGHAEFISERPQHNGVNTPLANFGKIGYTGAETAAPDTGWRPVLKQPRYSLTMVNGSHTLAVPGPGDSTGLGYSVNWRAAT